MVLGNDFYCLGPAPLSYSMRFNSWLLKLCAIFFFSTYCLALDEGSPFLLRALGVTKVFTAPNTSAETTFHDAKHSD